MKDNILSLIMIVLFITSCSKKEEILSENSLNNTIRNSLSSYNHIPLNYLDTIVPNYSMTLGRGNYPGIPVYLNKEANSDVSLQFDIDYRKEVLEEYDKIYGKVVATQTVPEGLFGLENNGIIHFKKGQKLSVDSIKIKILDYTKLEAGKTYEFVVPVSIQGDSKGLNVKSKIVFLQYYCRVLNFTTTLSPLAFNSTTIIPDQLSSTLTFNGAMSKKMSLEIEDLSSESLIAEYNKVNRTDYELFPKGTYNINNEINIPAHAKTLANGLKVTFSNKSAYNTSKRYLLPFRIKNDLKGSIQYVRYGLNATREAFDLSFGPGLKFTSMEYRASMAVNTLFQPIWNNIQDESVSLTNRYISYILFSLLKNGELVVRVYRFQAGNGQTGAVAFSRMYFEPKKNSDGFISYHYISTGSDGVASSSALLSSSRNLEKFLAENKFEWNWSDIKANEGGLYVVDANGKRSGVSILGALGTN